MNPIYSIALYLSIFSLLFILFVLYNIYKLNNRLWRLHSIIDNLKKDISKIQRAEKEVVNVLISKERSREIFREQGIVDIKKTRREGKRTRKLARYKRINRLLDNLEVFIGKSILDKFGIISFLIGLILLVSVGIEYDWINSIGRVFLGLVSAGILLALGYLIKNKLEVLSSIFIGGGLASLVLTLFSAFYVYSLLSLSLTYVLVVFIILVAIGLSIIMNRAEIAVLTFAAGFIAPLTVNLVSSDYVIIFSFVLLLNLGVILYDYFRKSLIINIVSFAFTYLIYAIWLINKFWLKNEDIPFFGAILFLSLFYLMIFVIVLINNIKENRRFLPLEFSMLIIANALYYTAGYIIITRTGVEYKGIFTLWIALVNYGFFLFLYKRDGFDRRILNLFLGLSIMFFALVIPVEYMGKSPTLVWALQAIVLMFVGIRADLTGMKLGSIELTILMLASLGFDLYDQYLNLYKDITYITPIFNKAFLSSMLAVFSLLLNAFLLKYEQRGYFGLKFIKKNIYQLFLVISALITFYIAIRLELQSFVAQKYEEDFVVDTVISVLNYGILLLLALPALFIRKKQLKLLGILSFSLAYLLYISNYVFVWADLRNFYLVSPFIGIKEYAFHYYAAIFLLIISFSGLLALRFLRISQPLWEYVISILMIGAVLVFLSNELDNIIVIRKYEPNVLIRNILVKVFSMYYTMLWSAFGVVLLILGFLFRIKHLRIGAFLLLAISIIKVFVYDYFKLGTDELMFVFIWLGFILLLGSIVYQLSLYRNVDKKKQRVYKADYVQ